MAKARRPLPTDYIDEHLQLCEGGILRWKKSPHHVVKVGDVAGNDPGNGYLRVSLKGHAYGYHRIVYYLAYGVDSVGYEIDHVNRNPRDNRPENLRLATETENKWNKGCLPKSKTGYRGIRKRFWGQSYRWEVSFRCKYIGTYKSLEEAIEAWESVAKPYAGEFFLPAEKP